MKKKLKIGILINNYSIPNWAFKTIEQINNSYYSEIVLVVKNNSKNKKTPFFKKINSKLKSILYVLYRKLDRIIYKNKISAFNLKDIRTIVKTPEIVINPIQSKFRDSIPAEYIKSIKNYRVDIFLRLGFRILTGDILKISNYGVWSFHHGDNDVNRGGPPGVWEVINGWHETGVTLQILNENLDAGTVLYKSFSLTKYESVNRNINNIYLKAISFIPLKIKELYDIGADNFFKNVEGKNNHPKFYSNYLFKSPKNGEMTRFFLKVLYKKIYGIYYKIFYKDQWTLLYKFDASKDISRSFYKFKKILPPKDRFWADPHVIKSKDKYYIFIEELIYKEKKGFISVIEIEPNGRYKDPVKVLEKDYHLSYPFVFEDGGSYYMIPESKENRTIDLYKSSSFPFKWDFKKTIINNIQAVDSTIYFYNKKYWLFTNVITNNGASSHDELFLYHSSELVSNEWVSHPMNPIVSDVKKARPAGNLFMFNDNLYRPSQNCSKNYGYGMKINLILKLTESLYEEKVVDSIFPNWDKNLFATHTLASCNNLTVIDGCFKRRRFF